MKIKGRRKAAKELFKLSPGKLEQIDLSEVSKIPSGMTRAFKNNRFVVMIFDNTQTTHGVATRALIQRADDQPIPNHWREIQAIKNEIFGPETVGVEYYPAESKVQDSHNIYWLWIYPPGIIPLLNE